MSQEINFETLTAQLLSIHQASIQAHLDKDVGFFTRGIAENYLSVSRGNINSPTPSEIEARFKSYLENTVFTEYENLQAPLIGFSDDGSLAWCIAQVKVAGTQKTAAGTEAPLEFTSAWLMLYKRVGDEWIRIADASTFK